MTSSFFIATEPELFCLAGTAGEAASDADDGGGHREDFSDHRNMQYRSVNEHIPSVWQTLSSTARPQTATARSPLATRS